MIRIKDAILSLTKKDEESITEAHRKALIEEYGDRRGGLITARMQKVAGYAGVTLGVTALLAAFALAPYIAAPTALGVLKASGILLSEIAGGTLGIGLVRESWIGSKLKKIPGRA